jgi:ABC-2 type transport system ATP-binding protein
MDAIRTENLSRSFGSLKALDRLSLRVERGEVFGFLGPNGSGKTTTIRLLLGLLEADEGRAEVLGLDTRTQADQVRARCGALLENNGLYERLSAADNLDYYGQIWQLPRVERETRIRDLLEPLELYKRRHEPIGRWSRGMKQKLAVARTLIHRPDVVFLDEPTAGLDPVASAALREDLQNLVAREGVTIFLTTHNLAEAEQLCTRVGVLSRGKLLAAGRPEELRSRRSEPKLYVSGRFPPGVVEQLRDHPLVKKLEQHDGQLVIDAVDLSRTHELVTHMVELGGQIDEVRRERADLQQVFLDLVAEEKADGA